MRTTPSKVARWVVVAFAAIAGYFWITEHRAHHRWSALRPGRLCVVLLYLLIRVRSSGAD